MLDNAFEAPLPIELRMAESLRELQKVLSTGGGDLDLGPVAEHVENAGALKPEAYCAYFALIRSIQASNTKAIPRLAAALANGARPSNAGIAVKMLNADEFGRVGLKEVRDNFASSSLLYTQMGRVPTAGAKRTTQRINDALNLIRTRAPRAWTDVSRITTEIIAAFGVSRGLMTFDGCSSLERYGSILVNMRRRRTPLLLGETLVHESAHSLLFSLSCNDYRVLNPSTELHKSPLRIDPRPLDGIYHAAFVLARMHGFLAEVALHPETSTTMRKEALNVLEERRKNFLDGHSVLIEHAKFTQIGKDLLDDAFERVENATRSVNDSR